MLKDKMRDKNESKNVLVNCFKTELSTKNLSKINCSDLCDVCSHVQDLFKALPNYKLSDRIKPGFKQCGGQIKRNVFIVIHKCENNKSSRS